MSHRRLLMGGSSGPAVVEPTDPPDEGGGDPGGPTTYAWPATTDPALLALRPAGRNVTTRRVGGENPTEASIPAAGTAGADAVTAEARETALFWDYSGPDHRFDVLVAPGHTHDGSFGWGGWGNIVGTSGDPEDVVIGAYDLASDGTMHSYGALHFEAITLRAYTDGTTSPKYTIHVTGGEIITFAHVIFDTLDAMFGDPSYGTTASLGMEWSRQGGVATLYRCEFRNGPGIASVNSHGGIPGDEPVRVRYIECDFPVGAEVGFSGPGSIDGRPDELWVIGCPNITRINATPTVKVFTDSDAPVYQDPSTLADPSMVVRGVTEWPNLDGGMSEDWDAYFYPSVIGTSTPVDWSPPVTDTAPMTPTTGRTYITRVAPDIAMRLTHVGFTGTATGGMYGYNVQVADTPYERDIAATPAAPNPDTPVGAGVNARAHYYYWSRYPGDNGWWVSLSFNGGAQVTGSAALPGITDCYYTDDGTTLVPVTAGTPHPVPFVRAT